MSDAVEAGGDESSQLNDLIGFLRDPRPEIRKAAVGMVEGLAGSPDGQQQLASASNDLLPALLWLVADSQHIAKAALTSLVNLSQDAGIAEKLLGIGVIDKAVDYIREDVTSFPELLVMILANVTATEKGCKQMLQLGRGDLEGFHMGMLLSRFIEQRAKPGDPYSHTAYILTNVTRLDKGQAIVLEPGRGYLDALVSQLNAENAVRRQGCSTALRNICFGAQHVGDKALAAVLDNQQFLEAIVEPLSGVTTASAAAGDDITREALAEAVLILAGTEYGRKKLWAVNTPERLRKGYEAEEHDGVMRAMEAAAEKFIAGSTDPVEDLDIEPDANVADEQIPGGN